MNTKLAALVNKAREEGKQGLGWTEVRTEAATKLWRDGLSASEIAKAIGGVSRNGIIGKVHRLGLKRSPRTVRETISATNIRRAKLAPSTGPHKPRTSYKIAGNDTVFVAAPVGPEVKSLPERPGGLTIIDPGFTGCRWPIGGDGAATRFCCAPKSDGVAYCAEHAARAYQVRTKAQRTADEARMANVRAGKKRTAWA